MKKTDELKQLLDTISPKDKICILTHNNPDPDALGAAFGLQKLFSHHSGINGDIVFNGIIGRMNNKQMVKLLEIPLRHLSAVNLDDYRHLCLVDSQPGMQNNSFPAGRPALIVVDHHPAGGKEFQCKFLDHRMNTGSTSTIIASYLRNFDIPVSQKLATALFYGIKTDTDGLARDSSNLDRELFFNLYPQIHPELLNQIETPDLPRKYYHDVGDAVLSGQVYEHILIADTDETFNPDMPAEMADFFLRMEGIEIVLVYGRYKNTLHFSLRTSMNGIRLGGLAILMVEGIGTAGGHTRAAGGQIPFSAANVRMMLERFYHFFAVEPGQFHPIYS
ncbi:MAG: bifunctional oligoribonuclease/PAP phosphatase NrnA [Acidobacteria bacterium]|nr:bifunctional oligoribonuclease/PAP phosphatase NrnA [Acidobacteriota bacterium]